MRSVIVCEGSDDFEIIANYLERKEQWVKCANTINLQEEFELPRIISYRGKSYGQYSYINDKLVIWSVGGKDSLAEVYNYISSQISTTSTPGIDQIFFFLDRDDDEIETVLGKIQETINSKIIQAQTDFPQNNTEMSTLQNSQRGEITFQILGENHVIHIVPLIIPFDRNGCLEDMLMQAIQGMTEGEYIVEQGKSYIEDMAQNEVIKEEYFENKARLEKKALFSAIMSVISPTRSITAYRELLNSVEWHEDENICEHFYVFSELLKSD